MSKISILYKKDTDRHVTRANTRSQQKYVFKVDAKIGNKYERSPYYVGISSQKIYNPLKMISCLKRRCLVCIDVTMKNMSRMSI